MDTTATNPLSRLAYGLSEQTLRAASVAGRIFGAGLALLIALDQTYDPTQVFTVLVAVVVLTTLAPIPGSAGDWLAAFGSGAVFFAGTVLTHLGPGLGLLAMGLLAGLASLALAARAGRDATLPSVAFVAAVFLTAGMQAAIVFSFE